MPTFKNEVTGSNQIAIVGISDKHHGVAGESKADGAGVLGASVSGDGVSGFSKSGTGVVGQSDAEAGVRGLSKTSHGVEGLSQTSDAVVGTADTGNGVSGSSHTGCGVVAQSESSSAVRAVSKSGRGVEGWSESSYGVSGDSKSSAGVRGTSVEGRGVEGWSTRSEGVVGICETGTGVCGVAGRSSIFGRYGDSVSSDVFRVGAAAKQWVESAASVARERAESVAQVRADDEQANATAMRSASRDVATFATPVGVDPPAFVAGISSQVGAAPAGSGVLIHDTFDDSAGIGVCGEHRAAGIGVKAVSKSGMGLAAYSTDYEAVHAETHSPRTAAIAAYNLNPRGTGAAIFARKDGREGHAGFFDGKVWVSGELAVGGDVVLANADCAEDFDVVDLESAEPGSVMVLGDDGVLRPCDEPYDKRAVGVISGAGQYKPGLILDKHPSNLSRSPVALLGKVCCKVTAENGAIEIGDLLTTSSTPGHAMRAADSTRAFGAVIGKALRPWREGTGLISILVALQ